LKIYFSGSKNNFYEKYFGVKQVLNLMDIWWYPIAIKLRKQINPKTKNLHIICDRKG